MKVYKSCCEKTGGLVSDPLTAGALIPLHGPKCPSSELNLRLVLMSGQLLQRRLCHHWC